MNGLRGALIYVCSVAMMDANSAGVLITIEGISTKMKVFFTNEHQRRVSTWITTCPTRPMHVSVRTISVVCGGEVSQGRVLVTSQGSLGHLQLQDPG